MRTLIFALALLFGGTAMAYDNQKLLRDAPSPQQDLITSEDAHAMWFRTPAGQYWRELSAAAKRGEVKYGDTLRLHRERFPGDGGPLEGGPPPRRRPAPPTLNAPQGWDQYGR